MGLSAIYGDIGTGKTSLAGRLLQQFADNPAYNFATLVHPNYPSPFQLIREIRRELCKICDNALVHAYITRSTRIDATLVKRAADDMRVERHIAPPPAPVDGNEHAA